MSKFESPSAAKKPDTLTEKPTLRIIQGGKSSAKEGKKEGVERWNLNEVMQPNAPKPRAHGAEAAMDVAAIMREDQSIAEDIRKKINGIQMPKSRKATGDQGQWNMNEVMQPNAPKPRAHGAEEPVDVAAIMRSDEDAAVVNPTGIEMPKPRKATGDQGQWSMKEVMQPNMPKPRAHGAEEPVDIAAIMRSDEDLEKLAGPKRKINLPEPESIKKIPTLRDDEFEEAA